MEANENDAERIVVLMTASGERVNAETVRARLADENGGVLVNATACVSWALDGGVLHLYDFAIVAAVQRSNENVDAEPIAPLREPVALNANGTGGVDASRLEALIEAANMLANGRFAAVIATTVWVDQPLTAQLLACGFAVDWEEADVRGGKPAQLAGLVREVT